MEDNSRAVSLYDTEKKQLIGVFKSIEISAKYLFTTYNDKKSARLSHSLSRKHKLLEGTIFDFPVAIRVANQTQIELLSNKGCYIVEEYPQRMNEKGQLK